MRIKWIAAAMMAFCLSGYAVAAMAAEPAAGKPADGQIGPGQVPMEKSQANSTISGPSGRLSEKDKETADGEKDGSGTTEQGTWKEENGSFRYYSQDGTYKKNTWAKIGGYWYYFDWDGYMATGWTSIAGYNYCFRDTGDLILGWCYNDDREKWYYFNPDGTAKKGWFHDKDGSWYWFSSWGEMVSSGYKSIDGKRYYFMDNGQMAANQYVGLLYMDVNGQRDKRYDISLEGRDKDATVPLDTRNAITEALKNVPREWIQYFVSHGWKILYYPDRDYFSAPESDGSLYYVYHKLDTSYRKLKFCKPEALTEAFGEYIGYAADCYGQDGDFAASMADNKGNIDNFVDVPSYYLNDKQFYFGKLVAAYLSGKDTKRAMEADSPGVCQVLRKVLYAWQPKDSPKRLPAGADPIYNDGS